MLVPLLLGSDKTLASNATGQNKFHPLYSSPGNVKNSICCAHCDALVPLSKMVRKQTINYTLEFLKAGPFSRGRAPDMCSPI